MCGTVKIIAINIVTNQRGHAQSLGAVVLCSERIVVLPDTRGLDKVNPLREDFTLAIRQRDGMSEE